MLTLTTGTMFIMWLGEQITERGIGNGMSLLIFAGIVVGFPTRCLTTFDQMQTGQIGLLRILFLLVDDGRWSSAPSSSSSAGTGGSPCSTPNASSAGGSTAGRARTSR